MEQIFLHLTELITSLYRLSMTIRTSTQKNRYIKSAAIDLSHYVRFDIEHTRHKFPLAQEFIVERLGKAISRRRQFIRYSGKHAAKLAVTIDKQKTESTTTATDLCGNEVVIPKKATFVDDMQSATSYATSFGSPGRVRMPSMPSEAADERPFECPICHTIEIVSDTYGWMKHVYRDLQPYVCTYRDCGSADETFESRHQWIKHENQEHRRIWTCSGHCNATFQSSTQLVAHIKKHSPVAIADAQIPALIAMRASPIARDTMHTCPLCSVKGLQEKALQRHLGHHHEELALFALPNDLAESENGTDSSVSSIQRRAEYFTFGREVKASHISAAVDDRSHT